MSTPLRSQEPVLIEGLCQTAKVFNTAATGSEREQGFVDLLNALCEYISNRYPSLVVEEALDPSNAVKYNPLEFIKMHVDLLQREAVLSADFFKWLLTKLIITTASTNLREESISDIRKYARDFISYIHPNEELMNVSLCLINQLIDFSSLTTLSLWNTEHNLPPIFEADKSINFEKYHQREKENIICTLLEILIADGMPVGPFSEYIQLGLWMSTIEIFSYSSLLTKKAILSMWSKLIEADAANWMVCRLAVDRLLQMEGLQNTLHPTYDAAKEIFYETFSKALRLFDTRKSLIGLDVGSVIYWANLSIAIYLNSLSHRAKEFLVRFAGAACEVLSSVELDINDWKDMEEFKLNTFKLITYFFEHYNEAETDKILYPFVLLLSQAEMEMPGGDWIFYVGNHHIPPLQSDVDRLKLNKKFVSVLQRCKSPATCKYLEKFDLPQETVFKFMEEASKNDDIPLFLTLTAVVSDLAIADCISPSISLPFLSLPFLSIDSIYSSAVSKRHSVPALKEFTKFAPFVKKMDKKNIAEARIYAIVPLTKFKSCSEWRRQLYTAALKDSNPRVMETALKHMHEFLVSGGISKSRFLVDAAIHLSTDQSDVVMNSLARCICVLDCQNGKDVSTYECDICRGSGRKVDEKNTERLDVIPSSLLKLVTETAKISAGSLKLSCSLLFHYPATIPEAHLRKTLVYIGSNDEAVREQYLHLFKHIISGSDNAEVSEDIQTKLPFYKAEMDDVVLDPFSAEYLTICVQYAKDKELATWAFGKHYSIILENQELEFLNSMRSLVRNIAIVSGITDTAVFMRRIRTITHELCSHLISFGRTVTQSGDVEQMVEEMMESLELTRKIFYFEDAAAMLKIAAKYIIPSLLMCSTEERPWAAIVLEKIRGAMKVQKEYLGTEYFPYFLVQWILKNGINCNESDIQFIYNTCGVHMKNIAKSRYLCTQGLLQSLSEDEKAICNGIAYVNRSYVDQRSFNLTDVLMIECEYVGHFLKYRWCLSADDYYEKWPILLQSLEVIIRRVDGNFLEAVANRLMSVLRAATKVGEAAIPVWLQFATRLSRKTFKDLLPRILIDIQPLLQYDSSDELVSLILNSGNKIPSNLENSQEIPEREHIVQTTFVLIGCDINGSMRLQKYVERMPFKDRPSMAPDELIKTCVRLLTTDCETVGKVVLQKLRSLLDGDKLNEELYSSLVPALLQTLRRCCDPECRILTVICIGRVGAVDPGRLELSHTVYSDETNIFVDDKDDFFVDLIERTWKAYSREPEVGMLEQIECAIQELLKRLVDKSVESRILGRLSDACRKDILPLLNTQLGFKKNFKFTAQRPVVNNVANFSEWLQQCFVLGANRVRQEPIKYVFRALRWISNTTDTHYTRYILSQLILRLIIEDDTDIIETYIVEMETVLTHVVEGGPSWVYLAAHIVFSILDTLELFAKHRKGKRKGNIDADPELKRTLAIIQAVASKKSSDGQLLIVIAAEKCNCFYRALKWCEQFAITESTDRHTYFTLERIYTSLQNVDGVLGAFECISKTNPPTMHERILALEAAGDYHEAMALYALSGPRNEAEMVKCLLRLNQPQLALCTSTAAYNKYLNDDSISDTLYANQVEAACLLQDWKQLETLVQKRDPLTLGKRSTWGASCASILCAVKRQEPDILTKRLKAARAILVDQLTAMTIEHSDTYTQAYNYVTQLHILDEIEDASEGLHLVSKIRRTAKNDLPKTLAKWQVRSENAIQCAASLESILSVRRELLKLCTSEDTKTNISQLLIQSCRLARQAGHLQIAWTFLVEAQSLDVNHKEVGLEQARFEFQKGDQQQAISLLTKLLHSRFNKMNEMFSEFVPYIESGARFGTDAILSATDEERTSFAEVQLLRAEYMMKAGAVSSSDLYKIYMALRKIKVPSEDLFYRIALFCDNLYSLDPSNVRTDLVNIIMKTYADALKFGRNHLFHAMPRMLTLWLDCTQKKHEQISNETNASVAHREAKEMNKLEIQKINDEMLIIFKQLDPYYFYKAFPQLISRIEHISDSVFDTLKIILSELLITFPHQCLWLSIAVYRTLPYNQNARQKRCNEIFKVAKQKDKRLVHLIDQYDYISQCLIRVAEQKCAFGTHDNLSEQFKQLYEFFNNGYMDLSLLMGAKERNLHGKRQVTPTIMVPLTEMMDHAIPKSVQTESFSQIMIDAPVSSERAMGAMPEVLIQKFENSYMVLKSMMQPKKLSIRSHDGRIFSIMVKPGDELRKDSRFMDVNRMMNSLMRQNPEARRRQLSVRTFTVIPLQSAGGILEWLPNLVGYRHALQPLFDEKSPKRMTDSEWFRCWESGASIGVKLKKIEQFYECYPRVMAEWFRREFVDPSSWHSARSNYSRSAAVMSMIGFVLGLGDRHGENILLDTKDGCVVHVDFNLIFNKGEQLPVKEIVPFRLTRNMIDGLGPTGVEGSFRKSCEATLKVMRDNKDTLLTVIQAFVHDPLLEWQDSTRAQQNRSRRGEKVTAGHLAADAVGLIGKRLEGHIVTPEVYRWKFTMSPMSLEGQVNKLIEIASDEKQLVQMYIGWAPFM